MNDVQEPSWQDNAPTQDPTAFDGDAWTMDNAFDVHGAVMGMDEMKGLSSALDITDKASKVEDLTDWPKLITLIDTIVAKGEDVQNAAEKFEEANEKMGADPLGWLAGTLVSFVIDLCQPLEDLLRLVTGNEGRMKTSVEMWLTVVEGSRQTCNYVQETGMAALEGWEGDDADAARDRINEIGRSIYIMGAFGAGLAIGLRGLAIIVKKLEDKFDEFLGKIVLKALAKWLPMAASGVATFGASTAAAMALAVATIASYVMMAVNLIQVAINIFGIMVDLIQAVINALPELRQVLDHFK